MACLLVLNDADPAGPLAVAWTQPDVVGTRKPDLEKAVGAQTRGPADLLVEPRAELLETGLCAVEGYRPLGRVLRILFDDRGAGKDKTRLAYRGQRTTGARNGRGGEEKGRGDEPCNQG